MRQLSASGGYFDEGFCLQALRAVRENAGEQIHARIFRQNIVRGGRGDLFRLRRKETRKLAGAEHARGLQQRLFYRFTRDASQQRAVRTLKQRPVRWTTLCAEQGRGCEGRERVHASEVTSVQQG